jgi:HEAT repeat protein/lysophospholipase L1-like esterase
MNALAKHAVNVGLAVGVSALTLAVLEGTCRLWERTHPPEGETTTAYLFKWRGRVPPWGPPGQEFNADGYRDHDHAVEKPEGVRRVVFLGDSVTLGYHVQPDEAFPQRLGAIYEAEGRPVEVFNIAMHGWSTPDERKAYRFTARRYRPDDVVLAVCLNDITALQESPLPPQPWLMAGYKRFALVRLVVHAREREISSVRELFRRADSPEAKKAMATFFAEVRLLKDEVGVDGARLHVLVLPFRFQVEPGAPLPVVQKAIESFAADEHLHYLDVLPALQALGETAFVDWDHLSPIGTRTVAEQIVQHGLLDLPPSPAEIIPQPGLPGLTAALKAPEPGPRAAAAWLLGRSGAGGPAMDAALAEMVHGDASEPVRAAAARALGHRHAAACAPQLLAALADERAAVRRAAALSLFELEPLSGDALPPLVASVSHPDPYVRGFAVWAIQNMGPAAAGAASALVPALADGDAFTRETAALALGTIGADRPEVVSALAAQLAVQEPAAARAAARALGRLGPRAAAAVPALQRAAVDPDDGYLRLFAVRALGKIAPADAGVAERLRTIAARDSLSEVRQEAVAALQRTPNVVRAAAPPTATR